MLSLTVLMAQINPTVGAIEANTKKIIHIIEEEASRHDIIVFPELAITGYPPEDLLFRHTFASRINHALQAIMNASQHAHVVVGHPSFLMNQCFNSASVFYQGACVMCCHKQRLPNYGVFDERRYFTPGPPSAHVFTLKGQTIGVCICEDLWQPGPVDTLLLHGATTLIAINASPFDNEKPKQREQLLYQHALRGLDVIYVNLQGGQDELVFDGQSMAWDRQGNLVARAPAFKEHLQTVRLGFQANLGNITPLLHHDALIYQALVCGLHDYVKKNAFPGVLLGLSGGIDSALTLAIAVDALGPQCVHAVLMPSRYTADMSHEDAQDQLQRMGIKQTTLSIEPTLLALTHTLENAGPIEGITAENLQARIRGTLLMALSNKTGHMVLSTSNKSETAVGYATLYGDMCGGFSVLKDVLKTQVYALARYRNTQTEVIPERVITRAPTAELAFNQTDQDQLPAYEVLDAIILAYMQDAYDAEQIIAQGHPADVVYNVIQRIKRNEYKRRQASPGVKISRCAFGKDWRYPITSG